MSPWSTQIPLPPTATWLPLGLAGLAPLVVAVVTVLVRRRTHGLAAVLALRTVMLLSLGFAALTAVATMSLGHTGIQELGASDVADLRRHLWGAGNGSSSADQAARSAWRLVALSYALLLLAGWSAWRRARGSVASRIRAIASQIETGRVDEASRGRAAEARELRELADGVTKHIERTLEQQQASDERYRRLVDLAPDGIFICSSASIKFANPAALALAGAGSRYDVMGVPIEIFLEFERPPAPGEPRSALRPARWTRVDGTVLHVEVAEIAESGGRSAVGREADDVRQYLVRDVTERRLHEAALAHRAEHDSLTGLLNRARFEARLAEVLDGTAAERRPSDSQFPAVLFLDLDGFKPVNDRHGHAAGDAVLVAVAERLREATRESDLIARLGGDEFGVLLEVGDREEVSAVAERILRALERPIQFNGTELNVGASIGMADACPKDADGPVGESTAAPARLTGARLLRAADIAMYAAKAGGGGRCCRESALGRVESGLGSPEPVNA